MNQPIISFISQYVSLTEDEIDIIQSQNFFKAYTKDSIILRAGDYAKECFFVLKGCIRKYYSIEGEEKNTDFYIENQTITPISYVQKKPSEYFLATLEDSLVAVGSNERNQALLEKVPKLNVLIQEMNTQLLMKQMVSLDTFKSLNPEMRYIKLMEERSDLIQRIPQYHLSSYLGITPQSLSRMRKRMSQK